MSTDKKDQKDDKAFSSPKTDNILGFLSGSSGSKTQSSSDSKNNSMVIPNKEIKASNTNLSQDLCDVSNDSDISKKF